VKSLDSDSCFSEIRRVEHCLRGDVCTVEDVTSTDMQIIDSLEKVWLVQKDLPSSSFSTKDQSFVQVVLGWPGLNPE
jgi:hypothetical protein